MDCANARILLLFYRPGHKSELTGEDVAALESHLKSCPQCSSQVAQQSLFDGTVTRQLQKIQLPSSLRSNLLKSASLQKTLMARRAWMQRGLIAASVLTAGLLGWGGYLRATRDTLDTEAITYQLEQSYDARENHALTWLNQNGLPLPEQLDLRWVQRVGELRLQNQTVPGMLLLQPSTGQLAWVYYLSPSRFDMSKADNAQGSSVTARFYRDVRNGWSVLIVHTGHDLRPFLRPVPEGVS